MLISAHDASNINYSGPNTGWQLGWSSQQLVTAAIVTKTGGTYELKSPELAGKTKIKAKK